MPSRAQIFTRNNDGTRLSTWKRTASSTCGDGGRVEVEQRVLHRRFDGRGGGDRGQPAGVLDRLARADVAADVGGDDRDEDQCDESGEGVPDDEP